MTAPVQGSLRAQQLQQAPRAQQQQRQRRAVAGLAAQLGPLRPCTAPAPPASCGPQRPLLVRYRQQQQRVARHVAAAASNGAVASGQHTCALIFDCDGVIVETEELHRLAYNAAFEAFGAAVDGVQVEWSVEYYDKLQNTVGGGKPKMRYHFNNNGWPITDAFGVVEAEEQKDALIDALQDKKTESYKVIVDRGIVARPGVLELMDEALARPDVAVCICSAATKEGFEKVVNSVVKPERLARFDVVMAGDDVSKKKPDPMIYNLAAQKLGIDPNRCIVIEDSMVGLRAALGAGMQCIITPTSSTMDAPFCEEGAAAVLESLETGTYRVGVDDLFTKDINGVTVPSLDMELEGDVCVVWPQSGIVAYNA